MCVCVCDNSAVGSADKIAAKWVNIHKFAVYTKQEEVKKRGEKKQESRVRGTICIDYALNLCAFTILHPFKGTTKLR